MDYIMSCGCILEVEVYMDYGCCELCSPSADVDSVEFTFNCEAHTSDADPA